MTKIDENRPYTFDELYEITIEFVNEQDSVQAFSKEHGFVYQNLIRYRNRNLERGHQTILTKLLDIMGYSITPANLFWPHKKK